MANKHKKVLKYLYYKNARNWVSMCEIKPVMEGWSAGEINHVLDDLKNKYNPPLINVEMGPNNFARIGVQSGGEEIVNLTNYTAKGFLTPEGEKYYRNNYQFEFWKKWSIISQPLIMLAAFLTIAVNIYTSYTTGQENKELKQSIKSLETGQQSLKSYYMGLDRMLVDKTHRLDSMEMILEQMRVGK